MATFEWFSKDTIAHGRWFMTATTVIALAAAGSVPALAQKTSAEATVARTDVATGAYDRTDPYNVETIEEQPWMVFHELAHGYHHQFLDRGFDNAELRAAFERAKESKAYENVLRASGRRERHYALTNPQEYFAEASEAYFGTNDFYPYVRAELREHDPDGCDLLARLWAVE